MLDQAISPRAIGIKAAAFLQLVRFPNLFTAAADVLAGCLIVAGTKSSARDVLFLLLGSALFYGAGCVLNDFFDRQLDARERPFRPIPSGRVSAAQALLLAFILFGTGLAFAAAVGGWSFRVAVVLVLLIIAYDAVFRKMDLLGPLNMAACRSANLLLGMSLAFDISRIQLVFPIVSFAYVFSLTVLSRSEVEGGLRHKGRISGGLAAAALIPLALALNDRLSWDFLIFMVMLAAWAGPPVARAFLNPTPGSIGKAVKFLVLGIPLMDAAYVAGTQGWLLGMPVVLCLFPALFFAGFFRVT